MTPQYLGNKELLERKLMAFLASRTVQTARVMACYDWATGLDAETDCVVSGFQSPIERDVLHLLLRRRVPVVVVLARSLYAHVPEEMEEAYGDGRVLFVSLTDAPRSSRVAAMMRNRYVVEVAEKVVFGMMGDGSTLRTLCTELQQSRNECVVLL